MNKNRIEAGVDPSLVKNSLSGHVGFCPKTK
jgi:hypothetical protein